MSDEIVAKIAVGLVLIIVGGVFGAIREICKGVMVIVIGRRFKRPSDIIELAQVIYHASPNGALSKFKAIFGGKIPNQSHEEPESTKKTAQPKKI